MVEDYEQYKDVEGCEEWVASLKAKRDEPRRDLFDEAEQICD